jgi:Ca-activated chloride channel family protein
VAAGVLSGSGVLTSGPALALTAMFLSIPAVRAQIRVDVDLVVLPSTVQDRHGRQVSDLKQANFAVYEDHVEQRIRLFRHEDIPVTVGLVVDHSGSMTAKLAEVTAGAKAFVRSSNADDQMFVVNFNETVSLGLPDAIGFTTNAVELERAIGRAHAAGQTALYDAIVKALAKLQAGSRDERVLVVMSDGTDNASAHSLAQVLDLAARSNVIIYTVGLFAPDDEDANPKVLRRLAQATGGQAFLPEELNDVVAICERIARDIRSQYTIGYFSTNVKPNGAYRTVLVAAKAPDHGKLFVRTRAGYIARPRLPGFKDETEK